MTIFCRTVLLAGSIRLSVPLLSVTIQILSPLAVIPPSGPAGPIASVAVILLARASTRTSEGFFPHRGTQILSNPNARPEHASPGRLTFSTILLVAGSIRCTEKGFVLATHTASCVIRTQSAVPPIPRLALDFKEANGA